MKPPNQHNHHKHYHQPSTTTYTNYTMLATLLTGLLLATCSLVTASSNQAQQGETAEMKAPLKHQEDVAPSSKLSPIDHHHHQKQQQLATDKKQGDQHTDLFNTDEYEQVKPEELNLNEQGADIDHLVSFHDSSPRTASSASQQTDASAQQQRTSQPMDAEHKSAADDELNAHMASNSIGSLESDQASSHISDLAPSPRSANSGPSYQLSPPSHRPTRGHGARAPPPPSPGYARGPRGHGPRGNLAPSYEMLRGKLIDGLSSMVNSHSLPYYNQPPPPPPQPQREPELRPHHGHGPQQPAPLAPMPLLPLMPHYFPRGAIAGYAAFREFVRAQANRYKQQIGINMISNGSHEPVAYNAAPNHNGGRYNNDVPRAPSGHPKAPPPPTTAEPYATGGHQPAGATNTKTKVSMAQAYIPHLVPASEHHSHGNQKSPRSPPASSLSSSSAAHGLANSPAGKPEYSKDFGMVIHYPQASIYTQPMTVDQVHKLTGPGISQVLDQVRHTLATGQRDESNTIRPGNKHHLGHGLTIHAKEYYAPSKNGRYVPTTAAVISASPNAPDSANYYPNYRGKGGSKEQHAAYDSSEAGGGGHHQQMVTDYPDMQSFKPEQHQLGSGYARVKTAVANHGSKYNNQPAKDQHHHQQQRRPSNPPQPAHDNGNELEAIYGPNVAAQIQSFADSDRAKSPIKYTEHDHKSPLTLMTADHPKIDSHGPPTKQHAAYPPRGPTSGHYHAKAPRSPYDHPPPPPPAPATHGNRYPQPRPSDRAPHHSHAHAPHPHQHHRHNQNQHRPNQQQQYQQPQPYHPKQQQQQQQQAYGASEQALHQQMVQILRDFQMGDEQYGYKNKPAPTPINQSYPNRLLQKYKQQHSQQYGNSAAAPPAGASYALEHNDALEIPQGPNDQIGEISDLIEALKGTLESYKPDEVGTGGGDPAAVGYGGHQQQQQAANSGKLDDVRYLTSTLGQQPSYAIQVPVTPTVGGAVHETARKATAAATDSQNPQPQPANSYQPPSEAGGYPSQAAGEQPYGQRPQPMSSSDAHGSPNASSAYPKSPMVEQPPAHQGQPIYGPPPPTGPAPSDYNQPPPPAQGQPIYGPPPPTGQAPSDYNNQPPPSDHHHPHNQQQPQPMTPDYPQQAPNEPGRQQQPQLGYLPPPPPDAQDIHHHHQQQPQQQHYQQQPQPAAAYTSDAAAQVIDHLLAPINQQQQQHNQAISQHRQQYEQATNNNNQISFAAPTESQYQSAQSLSSFVDSLPTDYQDFLRQPPTASQLFEPTASGHEHLLSTISDGYQVNATTITTAAEILKSAASSQSVGGTVSALPPNPIESNVDNQAQQATGAKPALAASSSSSASSSGAAAKSRRKA